MDGSAKLPAAPWGQTKTPVGACVVEGLDVDVVVGDAVGSKEQLKIFSTKNKK